MPHATTAVNLEAKLATFAEHWSPKIVATYNGNDIYTSGNGIPNLASIHTLAEASS